MRLAFITQTSLDSNDTVDSLCCRISCAYRNPFAHRPCEANSCTTQNLRLALLHLERLLLFCAAACFFLSFVCVHRKTVPLYDAFFSYGSSLLRRFEMLWLTFITQALLIEKEVLFRNPFVHYQ